MMKRGPQSRATSAPSAKDSPNPVKGTRNTEAAALETIGSNLLEKLKLPKTLNSMWLAHGRQQRKIRNKASLQNKKCYFVFIFLKIFLLDITVMQWEQ